MSKRTLKGLMSFRLLIGFFFLITASIQAEEGVYDFSIEELMKIKISSVSGVEKKIFDTPSAITIITAEDIAKSGSRTIPDLLRNVPGLHVAQTNSQNYAVSSRGFTDRFSSKMLVLIDGRSVYAPIFSGVFWDIQDLILEDIEKIEVIRGPGATLWGANAVNGVINITTKSSFDTEENLLNLGVGTFEQGFVTFRHGDAIDDETSYRIFGKFFNRDSTVDDQDRERPDDWSYFNSGFRVDHRLSIKDTLTVQGNYARTDHNGEGTVTQNITPIAVPAFPGQTRPVNVVHRDAALLNGNLLINYVHSESEDEGYSARAYFDYEQRDLAIINEEKETFDIEFRQWLPINEKNDFIYGLGFRTIKTEMENTDSIQFTPENRRQYFFNAFVQNTYHVSDSFFIMLGSKFEHNDFTGFEVQPSLRLNYNFEDDHQLWFSVSRAVRIPSLVENDINFRTTRAAGGGLFAAANSFGDRDSQAEELLAWESGFRWRVSNQSFIDISFFYNEYDRLVSFQNTGSDPLALEQEDADDAETYGVELQVNTSLTEDWDFGFNYSHFKQVIHGTNKGSSKSSEGFAPHNMFGAISDYSINDKLSFHVRMNYYDSLKTFNIPSYIKVDAGLIWDYSEKLQFQLWGKNLLNQSHREFRDDLFEDAPHQIERSAFISMTYKF